jgi:hypothetical protein
VDERPPTLEIRVPARAPPRRALWALGVIGAFFAFRYPYEAGVAVVLPVLFAGLGWAVAIPRRTGYALRFLETELEIVTAHASHRVPWSRISSAKQTQRGLLLALPWTTLEVPAACLPDTTALRAALPEHLTAGAQTGVEVESTGWVFTLVWILVCAVVTALYLSFAGTQ